MLLSSGFLLVVFIECLLHVHVLCSCDVIHVLFCLFCFSVLFPVSHWDKMRRCQKNCPEKPIELPDSNLSPDFILLMVFSLSRFLYVRSGQCVHQCCQLWNLLSFRVSIDCVCASPLSVWFSFRDCEHCWICIEWTMAGTETYHRVITYVYIWKKLEQFLSIGTTRSFKLGSIRSLLVFVKMCHGQQSMPFEC